VIQLLLGSGANPNLTTEPCLSNEIPARPVDMLRRACPEGHPGIPILAHALVVKLRRIVITHTGDAAPYCTRDQKKRKSASELPTPFDSRVRRGKALPSVTLAMPEPGYDDRCRKALAFVVGLEGPGGKRLPSGVFRLMMDMLIVRWDPLRDAW
jgi:hypothetical protein